MANLNTPFGFRPVQHLLGLADWSEKLEVFCIRAADTAAYWIGDTVTSVADGDAHGIPVVTKILAGTEATALVKGVVLSFLQDPAYGNSFESVPITPQRVPIPAAKTHDYYVLVAIDPYVVYEIEADGVFTAAMCNSNASYAVVDGLSTVLAPSATVLTIASVTTTATLPLKILGISKDTSSNQLGAFCRVRVRFNIHESFGGTVGV